jgi:hypothetical protein
MAMVTMVTTVRDDSLHSAGPGVTPRGPVLIVPRYDVSR